MSSVYHSANPGHVFASRDEIRDHLLAKVESNASGQIGTELELFVTTPEGEPIPFETVGKVLGGIAAQFPRVKAETENGYTVGLAIPGIGAVTLEPGGQVELAPYPAQNLKQLEFANQVLRTALENAARDMGLKVEGTGHKPSFLEAGYLPRSRFLAYRAYLHKAYGVEKADDLMDTMKSTAGLQINLDPMGKDFHEVYRALLLTDVANAMDNPTARHKRLHETYASLVPEQLTPVFAAVAAKTNTGVMEHIVDRLLTLKVPFVPDAEGRGFVESASVYGETATVGEMLRKGVLTVEIFDNALSLQLTMPNLRRHGVLETRAPDSPQTVEEAMDIARLYTRNAYDADARRALLERMAGIEPEKLEKAYADRFNDSALKDRDIGGGLKVADLLDAVALPALPERGRAPALKARGG